MTFEDFTTPELRVILSRMIESYKWGLEDARVVDVAARRVARGRGVKGFANARSCRTAMERAYQVTGGEIESTAREQWPPARTLLHAQRPGSG